MRYKPNRIPIVLALAGILVLGISCSTKKNTFTRRTYHNLTARYNAYFNGAEALKTGVRELEKKHVDNYNKVLPVFQYGTAEDAVSVNTHMERTVEKGSKVIARHSMRFKNKEYNKWVDDAFLMIGKARFYKRDYILAKQTLNYVRNEYRDSPVSLDASLWYVRTLIAMKNFEGCEAILSEAINKSRTLGATKSFKRELPLVYADYYLQQQNYGAAIEHLENALEVNRKKKIKTRISFILAQVYQKEGELKKSSKYYQKVIKMNPPYVMAFNARINLAWTYDSKSGDNKMILKELEKMLKDDKNIEYQDQIYYALAQIAISDKDTTLAVEHLKNSVAASVNNAYQKSISYLKLGEIFYVRLDYPNSQIYYDSCVQTLPEDFENYKAIKSKSEVLTSLIENLNTIHMNDSLIKLAGMTPEQQNAVIDGIIRKLEEEEAKQRQLEAQRQKELWEIKQNTQGVANNQGGNSWYFYNPTAVSYGYAEFNKKWGERPLEDLWRLSNKVSTSMNFGNEEEFEGDSIAQDSNAVVSNKKDRRFYLQSIPKSTEEIAALHDEIQMAYFNAGLIYKEGLDDLDRAISTLEELEKQYPNSDLLLSSWYHLYRIFKGLNFKDKEEIYKNKIIKQYPNSDYAKIIQNPDYYKELAAKKGKAEKVYGETYTVYLSGDYAATIQQCNTGIATYTERTVQSKFAYLRALSIGKSKGEKEFEQALKEVVAKYPEEDVKDPAQNILNYLDAKRIASGEVVEGEGGNEGDNLEIPSIYKYNPKAYHFFVCVVPIDNFNINEMKILFSNLNQKMFASDKLNTNSVYLNSTSQIITVSNFDNQKKGMRYVLAVDKDPKITLALKSVESKKFLISAENYAAFYKSKDVDAYMRFFKKHYKE